MLESSPDLVRRKALGLYVLNLIVAVSGTGNISRVAEVVHRSKLAVNMQI
jgi:DNA-binding transcriptional LysR family regulator